MSNFSCSHLSKFHLNFSKFHIKLSNFSHVWYCLSPIGYLVLKSLGCACLTKHHSTAMASFWLPCSSRCRLCAAVRTARTHDFSYVLSLAHYPSRTRLPQTKLFCIQALWQCLSMPWKPRPLEALNSIVSAGPRDLRRNKRCTDGVRVHGTVTCGGCQVPQEIG